MSRLARYPGAVALFGLLLFSPHAVFADDDGSIMRTLIPAVAYGTTFYMHDHDGRIQFYKSFFANMGATYALKAAISKERPNGEDDDSFPSGHTSVAFQGAAFIHKRYGLKYAAAAYAGAAYVGWRRVATDNHYTVDVVAGAAIGIASSFIFTKPYKGFAVTPLADNGVYGIAITKQW
jgi:membrane-associated phospholipid phosphatase